MGSPWTLYWSLCSKALCKCDQDEGPEEKDMMYVPHWSPSNQTGPWSGSDIWVGGEKGLSSQWLLSRACELAASRSWDSPSPASPETQPHSHTHEELNS